MPPGLLALHTRVRGRRLVTLVCAVPALAWLALAVPAVDRSNWRPPAESAAPLVCIWFPLVAAPLLWSQGLRR